MRDIAFDGTFSEWRTLARRALRLRLEPSHVRWRPISEEQHALFHTETVTKMDLETDVSEDTMWNRPRIMIPRATLNTLEAAACFRDPDRWNLLYRVVWRIVYETPSLMENVLDPDIHRIHKMVSQVRREVHKMHAFVRFREVRDPSDQIRFVAWFEPAHDIVMRAAPFFVTRFPSMSWSILTPDCSIHHDDGTLREGPGVPRDAVPTSDDSIEQLWTTYYRHIFNPARLNTKAMQSEMPKRYWKNLPEAQLIGELVRQDPLIRQPSTRRRG